MLWRAILTLPCSVRSSATGPYTQGPVDFLCGASQNLFATQLIRRVFLMLMTEERVSSCDMSNVHTKCRPHHSDAAGGVSSNHFRLTFHPARRIERHTASRCFLSKGGWWSIFRRRVTRAFQIALSTAS